MENKLAVLAILLRQKEQESNRFWGRSIVFVIINLGLMLLQCVAASIPLCLLGLFQIVCWFHVLRLGKFYETRWALDVRAFLADNPELEQVFAAATSKPRAAYPGGPKSSSVMMLTVIMMSTIWLLALYGHIF